VTADPLVISHRTNMGTMPENTLAGIQAALRDGADGIEVDVRATRDGELVLQHDTSLERATADDRLLADVTLDQLRRLRVQPLHAYQPPEPIPTLREALAAVDARAILVLELKESGLEERVARLVHEANAVGWCWAWSFLPAACVAMHRAAPELPVSLLWGHASAEQHGIDDPIARAVEDGLAGISVHHSLVDAVLVERAHAAGLRVSTWTINGLDDIDRVRDAGVDAICGDVPPAIAGRLGR
jgi:glycerophosphoryl diester phosphodiesterase